MDESICYMPAVELKALMRARKISPVEIVEAARAQADRWEPHINALITRTDELAMDTARKAEAALQAGEDPGPLGGLPITIKDLTDTKGVRTTYGVATHADHVPQVDAPIARRVRAAGAALLGKSSTPGYGWLGVTENDVCGCTNNPWALGNSVGGSSGGAGALIAAGVGQLATGSDGGGSIRVPAALCGVVGLKPSHGRIPRGTESDPFDTVDALGPMARTVADVALLFSVMAGPVEDEPYMLPGEDVDYVEDLRSSWARGLRIAFCPDLGNAVVDQEIADIVAEAARHFERALSAVVTPLQIDIADPIEYFITVHPPIVRHLAETDPGIAAMVERYPENARLISLAAEIPATEWLPRVQEMRARTFSGIAKVFEDHDFILTPTVPIAAWPHDGEKCPAEINGRPVEWPAIEPQRFTEPFGHSCHPAITIPCGFTRQGLPVGLQIVGRQRDDRGVMRAAAAYEASTDWHKRKPLLPLP